jgi:hypothetical protein
VEVIRSRIETKEAGHALRASCAYRSGTRRPARLPCREAASFKRAGHVQQLGGESPLHNLMEVKC